MASLTTPVQINMTHLLLQSDIQTAKATPVTNAEHTATTMTALSQAIADAIEHYHYVIITNKGRTKETNSYFVLSVHPENLRLMEQNGFQKCTYLFSITDIILTVNEKPVDASFVQAFLGKIDRITSAIIAKTVTLIGKNNDRPR